MLTSSITPRFRVYMSVLALCTPVLLLGACDFGGAKEEGKKWQLVEVEKGEQRTAGGGLKWVMMGMAPEKQIALKPLSADTPPELLEAQEVKATDAISPQNESMMGIRISKHIPLKYGPLNFYSTKPKPRSDEHILDERPKITILKDYNERQMGEKIEEVVPEQPLVDVVAKMELGEPETPVIETVVEDEAPVIRQEKVKKADSLFKKIALGNKK